MIEGVDDEELLAMLEQHVMCIPVAYIQAHIP
jgi:hypothetical protein